jgi:hypothetical protein
MKGVNSATVGYAKSMSYDEALKLKDYEYYMATLSPTKRYPLGHEAKEITAQPKFVGIKKASKRQRAIALGAKRFKGGSNA